VKKKILFWVDIVMAHFGLAYQLQQKLDVEMFAIIDTPNKPKKMFKNQKIINFQKTWFFHDHIKKTLEKPDLEYLSNFEKKYNIDLWKLTINERHFYKYNKFYKFTTNHILKILEQECKLFESILDEIKPDYLFINEPPFHYQKLFVELCKAKKIIVLSLHISKYKTSMIIVENNKTFDFPKNLDSIKPEELSEDRLDDDYNKGSKKWGEDRTYSLSNKLKALKDYIFISDSKNVQTNFTYYGRKKYKVILETIALSFRRRKRYNYLKNNSERTVNLDTPFVYFPLGIDDDVALLHNAPFFTDQVEVVKHVAKSVPIDYKVYVKDHIHGHFRGWRDIKQYEEIKNIQNVNLIHPSFSSRKLIKNCKIVISVNSGGSTVEAAYENKPAITFTEQPINIIPTVYKVESLTKLHQLIKKALKTPINPENIKKYDRLIRNKKIDFSWASLIILRNKQFYSGNILSDVEYPEDKVKEFFKKNDKMFKILADEHVEKMNEFECIK